MFYGVYELDGKKHNRFYYEYESWYRDTWSPATRVLTTIDFHVHGDNYKERKADVEDKAMKYLDLFETYDVSVSWQEISIFNAYFAKQAKRYGLVTDFRENGIC